MSNFDERMAILREKFVARARQDSEALGSASNLKPSDLVSIAHRLSGSAGMFGFRQLSEKAEALEEAVRRDESPAVLHSLVDELRAQIAAI